MLKIEALQIGRMLVLAAALCLVVFGLAQKPSGESKGIVFAYRPIWVGGALAGGPGSPLICSMDNNGGNDQVTLTVKTSGNIVQYPVEMPGGSSKSITVYPRDSVYASQEPFILVNSKQGLASFPLNRSISGFLMKNVGVVSDATGLLSGLGQNDPSAKGQLAFQSYYCRIKDAPDRTIGYTMMGTIVLYEGAERLPDECVDAIKRYMLLGGTVLMTGGPSPIVLRDERWASALPVIVGDAVKIKTPKNWRLEGLEDSTLPAVQLTPKRGADVLYGGKSHPLGVQGRFGAGHLVVLAFDPFRGSMRTWTDGQKFYIHALTLSQKTKLDESTSAGSYSPRASVPTGTDTSSSVFQIQLPNGGVIALILVVFGLVAVPLNMGLLARKSKSEWAWLTTPLISFAFAAIFFTFAGSLYKAGLARASSGRVDFQEGFAQGYFRGNQSVFVPQAGLRDLRLHNVEAVSSVATDYSYDRAIEPVSNLVDTGKIESKQTSFPNLAFRQYEFFQVIPNVNWKLVVSLKARSTPEGADVTGTLTNNSPYALSQGRYQIEAGSAPFDDCPPGATVEFKHLFHTDKEAILSSVGQIKALTTLPEVGCQFGKLEGGPQTEFTYTFATSPQVLK